jgi:anti-anti-sigma regulatory factor
MAELIATAPAVAPPPPRSPRRLGAAPDDLVHVRVSGPLTVVTAGRVRRLLRGYLKLGDVRLLVDLSAVTLVDAAGIAALLDGARAAQAEPDGIMVLRVNAVVREALKRSGTVAAFRLLSD